MEKSEPCEFQKTKASKGSHFQFRSEKEWRSLNIPTTSRFVLNMKTLAEDLSTIPFYKRQQLPKEYFSREEIAAMDMEAESCAMKKALDTASRYETSTDKKAEEKPRSSSPTTQILHHIKSLEVKESPKKEDDLEDWLDSVLDD